MFIVVGIFENWCVGIFKRGMGVLLLFFWCNLKWLILEKIY